MPWAPRKPCADGACRVLVPASVARCPRHARAAQQAKNEGRGGSGWAWQKVLAHVIERDGYACTVLDGTPHAGRLEGAHVIPVEEGGRAVASNVVTKCARHHAQDTREHARRRAERRRR